MVGEDITHKDWCPTDSTDLHGYYSVGLTKTDINPLRLMQVSYEPWMAQPSENP